MDKFTENFLNLLKIINLSQHPQTKLWIFELINGFCVKMDKALQNNKYKSKLVSLSK